MTNKSNAQLSQAAFNQLILTYQSSTPFADYLATQGFSSTIENITIDVALSHAIDFSHCQFNNVTISGDLQNAIFDHTDFTHVTFNSANLSSSVFNDVKLDHCTFSHSKLAQTSFNHATLVQNNIFNCDFSDSSFAHSQINKTLFSKSKFDNALDHENVLVDNHMVFSQQYQNDYVFQNAQTHIITPTVVVVDDAEWHGTPYYILGQYGALPSTVDQYNPMLNDTILAQEVHNALNDVKTYGLKYGSIAEQVINSDQPTIKAINEYAHHIMENADAVWIPGGADLHPEFYNEQNVGSYPSYSYYREVLEFSLAQAAIEMNKPIIGICHGSQLMNVYLGGTLHQHVETPYGDVPLTTHKNDGLIGSIIDDKLIGPSYHHQAVKDIAKTLEVVATSEDGVIKATQPTDGKKIMLCQFHPEYEADQSSINILNQFVNLSAEQKIKSKAIELADVLDLHHDIPGLSSETKANVTSSVAPYSPLCHITEHLPALSEPSLVM